MAEPIDNEANAEKAYAEAAAKVADVVKAEKPAAPEVPVVQAQPEPVVESPKAPAPKAARKAPVAKPAAPKKAQPARKPAARSVSRRKPAVAAKAKAPVAPVKVAATPKKKTTAPAAAFSVTQLKEKIMATKTPKFAEDFTETVSKTMTDAVAEMQAKAQVAYDKGTAMVADMTELAKGNVEAVVESGKILAAGAQDLGKVYADEAKAAYETLTADLKEMAAVKSPTELFQLQGKILRRNFDAMVAATSKGSEAGMKLANDAFAPISARVNLAVEKFSKAA